MSTIPKTRGRPKGSGVDDARYLAAIRRLIDENPGMKPTTAIKALGVADPSTIRRLRDKHNSAMLELDQPAPSLGTLALAEKQQPRTAAAPGEPTAAARSIALRQPSTSMRRETTARIDGGFGCEPTISSSPRRSAEHDRSTQLMTAFCSAGLIAAQLALQFHVKAMSFALKASPTMCLLHGHALLDLMMASLPADDHGNLRATRH
jgi:hypothetical protein